MSSPEQLVSGRFEIIGRLELSGADATYEARSVDTGRGCALRRIPAEVLSQPDCTARFHQWALKVGGIVHPHLARVYAIDKDPSFGPYIVTDLVSSRSLAHVARQDGALHASDAVRIAAQIADALVCIHEHDVVLANLTPRGIVLADDTGSAVVFELGLDAALHLERESDSTLTGALLGDLRYASRERLRGDPEVSLDVRTDVYSVGVILYELLAGKRFLAGLGDVEVVMRVGFGDGWAPSLDGLATVPDALAQLIRDCLELDRNRRLDSAGTLRQRLEALGADA